MHARTGVFEYIGMFYNPWCKFAGKGMTPRLSCKFSGKVTSVIRLASSQFDQPMARSA
jgi:hypothetical protein